MSIMITLVLILAGTFPPDEKRSEKLSFAAAPGSPIRVGSMTGRPVIGDMNGDKKPDVVLACGTCCGSRPKPDSGHVVVLLNDGHGALRLPESAPLKVGESVRKVALGDVNEDGKLDVVAAEHDTYNVTVLLGDGRGGLSPAPGSPVKAASGARPHTHEIATTDVNRDGHVDVLTTNANDNTISVLLGNGKGGFAPAAGSPVTVGGHPYDGIALADLNADGNVDLAAPMLARKRIWAMLGDGKGGFSPAPGSPYNVDERPGYVAAADVNGDGRPDLIATHDDYGIVDVLLGAGDGKFRVAKDTPIKLATAVWGIASGDFDGDGHTDLLLGAMGKDAPVILLGDGKGGFRQATDTKLPKLDSPNYVAAADLNGDGRMDIVTGNYGSGDVAVFLAASSK